MKQLVIASKNIITLIFLLFGFNMAAQCWQQVNAGDRHTVAIKSDDTLWAWGDNYKGQLGDGANTNQNTPIQIGADNNRQQVAAGILTPWRSRAMAPSGPGDIISMGN